MMDHKYNRMKELVSVLQQASKAYYAEDREIISNFEYDKLYDELENLEKETGTVLAGSPTVTVGYESVDSLPKQRHEKPMLSLGKTKDREELRQWLQEKEGLLSWKLDGLTIVLTYQEGALYQAVTRGNGEIGEIVTGNAKTFKNLPLQIPYQGELVLRGEAVITYTDFQQVNNQIEDAELRYKNPRNLCSGSVRQLNSEVTAKRNVRFFAFSLVKAEDIEFNNSRQRQFEFLKEQGFDIVEYIRVDESSITSAIEDFEEKIKSYDVPSDGLVLMYDDIAYGESLGTTSKFPRNAIAFKWQDEIKETRLLEMEWSPSRTGLINPVAVFEPVELEGTTVSRASVHNVSIVRALQLGLGDIITVYKANMIIPQLADNLTRSGSLQVPETCPACGGETQLKETGDVAVLYCPNASCPAKKIKAFSHFVSRNAMNIEGLSEATLEKFIAKGYIHSFKDIYNLSTWENKIREMEGFGEKSFHNLMESIEKSRQTTLPKLLYSLGIANIGLAGAKLICKHFQNDCHAILEADVEQLSSINGIGQVIATTFCEYFAQEENLQKFWELYGELHIEKESQDTEKTQILEGLTFVVTGSLEHFSNRSELKELIESLGGKVTGSVTSKTHGLINNDRMSASSKNKTAKSLGVEILTEDEFLERYGIGNEFGVSTKK